MGLRDAFRRRPRADARAGTETSDSPALPGAAGSAALGHRHQADPATGLLVRTEVAPPVGGGLISGSAQLRQESITAPAFYSGEAISTANGTSAPPMITQPTMVPPPISQAPTAPPPISQPPHEASRPLPTPERPHTERSHTERPHTEYADSRPSPSGPSAAERALVRGAWDGVSERADQFVRMFYAELFLAMGGEAFAMFPASMAAQRQDFGRALVQWVVTDDPEAMTAQLDQLGADHRKFSVEPRHYDVAATALLNTWRRMAGAAWTDAVERAVVASYTRLASVMIDGAVRRRDEPATWGATVLNHERKKRDFAVLRIQPDAPYSFRPGQYLTLELASLPKQWRQMSFASAPRPDNSFDIQVRAMNATGVSGALVAHTRAGDRLRLGPPRGNDLVIEPGTTPGGLLGICSGTGSAPITAVVEALASRPESPTVYVFVGGRDAADLHQVETLERIVSTHGHADQIRVYGVASDDPTYHGFHGRVEELVPQLHPWAQLGLDVIIAGPDAMTAATVRGLTSHGVPLGRIHFDQYDSTR